MTETYFKYIKKDRGRSRRANRCCYKHDYVVCAQVLGFDDVMVPFLKQYDFTHIIEIGTSNGGFTYFLHDVLPQAVINTYDILPAEQLNNQFIVGLPNVNVFVTNIFDNNYNIISNEFLQFITNAQRLLVVVDGGNKNYEAHAIAPYLRKDDLMIIHDYKGLRNNKEWDKWEVSEQDLINIATSNKLKITHLELESVVWGCMQKIS